MSYHHMDSTCHALFWCAGIKKNWKDTSYYQIIKQVCNMDIVDVFMRMQGELCREELEHFAMRTWAVWHDRLQVIHSNNQRNSGSEVSRCITLLQEYQSAVNSTKTGAGSTKTNSKTRWTKPPENRLKMNVDAAVNWDTNSFAVGGVV